MKTMLTKIIELWSQLITIDPDVSITEVIEIIQKIEGC